MRRPFWTYHPCLSSHVLRWVLVALLAILQWNGLQAQQDGKLKRAHALYEQLSYLEAAKLYEQVLAKRFDKTAMVRLADCYRLTNNDRKAALVYSKVVNLNQIAPINYFYFAQSLMNLGMYPEAAKWFEKYAEVVPADLRGARFAASCRNIGSFFADTADIALKSFPFNTKQDEFSPIWYRQGILFSSSRGEGDVVARKYDWNGQPFLDLYFSRLEGAGENFGRPYLVKGKLNTRFHEATCAYDSVANLAYFTRNNLAEGKKVKDDKGIVNLKLLYADVLPGGQWVNVRSLPFNSDQYSVGHPAVLPGGEAIVFISNMPGGIGGTDLYISRRQGDAWSDPMNLGPGINTPGDEMFPYVTSDFTLYFSSDGLGGLGGLDVFRVVLGEPEAKPQNLGAPINSTADDFGYLISSDRSWGMFSSNRTGGVGSDDIYLFNYRKPVWEAVVLDGETKLPVADAVVQLHLPPAGPSLSGKTDAQGRIRQLLQRDREYQVQIDAPQYRPTHSVTSSAGMRQGDVKRDTFLLERPAMHITTQVLDPNTGFPVPNASVRVVGSDLTFVTDSSGVVSFYHDPNPQQVLIDEGCPPSPKAQLCFKFSDEGFFDNDTLKLRYQWSFGDGTQAEGLEVRHCYALPGLYQVQLNLLDPAGNLFFQQASYELEVRAPKGLQVQGPDTAYVGREVAFQGAQPDATTCRPELFQWRISDGTSRQGADLRHTFTQPGIHTLQLSTRSVDQANGQDCNGCVTKEVLVLPASAYQPSRDSLRAAWSVKALTPPPSNFPCNPQQPEDYCYTITDSIGLRSDSLPYLYRWDLGDGTFKEGRVVHHCFAAAGTYLLRLEVLDPYSRQLVSKVAEYELEVRDLHQVYIDSYDTVAVGESLRMDAYKTDVPDCRIKSVSWQFGDGASAVGPEQAHAFNRKGTFRIQMVVQGQDNTGKPCTRCSFKEVTVIPGYKGVALRDSIRATEDVDLSGRATAGAPLVIEVLKEGYEKRHILMHPDSLAGEYRDSFFIQPLARDASVMVAVRDADTGELLRDAVVLLRDLRTGTELGSYTVSSDSLQLPLKPGLSYLLVAKKPGFIAQAVEVGPLPKSNLPVPIRLSLPKAVIGKSWVLQNLYYDFDKSYIRHDAAVELTKLIVLLRENPQLTVQLGSHTDCRGSDDYNLGLAQARADAAVAYLKARGLHPRRIFAQGYGEQRLTNPCDDGQDCNEAQHQANRRTEITVLGFKDPIYSVARPVEDIWSTEPQLIQTEKSGVGPYAVVVGAYLEPRRRSFFASLQDAGITVQDREQDGFWIYSAGDFPTYAEALTRLEAVRAFGFANASILAVPGFTLPASTHIRPEEQGNSPTAPKAENTPSKPLNNVPTPVQPPTQPDNTPPTVTKTEELTANPAPATEDFYAVQVAATVQPATPEFIKKLGTYSKAFHQRAWSGKNICLVGKYTTEAEANKHRAALKAMGQDGFIVRFVNGQRQIVSL